MRSCELAVESVDSKVAFGRVIDDEDMNKTIHRTHIHPGWFRVSVHGSIDDNALVPVHVPGEIVKVSEAVGSHLAWPKDLVIFPTIVKKKKQVTPKDNDQMKRLGALFKKLEPNKNVPTRYKLLYKHALTTMKETRISIEISCDAQVFGTEKTIFILHENVISLCEFGMVGQAAISAYMAFHWILIIIWESDIYTLNPLPHSGRFPELEKALKSALKTFNSQTGMANRIAELQNLPGSPKQPGATECGYVVMRYMRDIIFDDNMYLFSSKWLLKTRTCYDVKVLDEVCLEALDIIEKAM